MTVKAMTHEHSAYASLGMEALFSKLHSLLAKKDLERVTKSVPMALHSK